MMQLRVDLQSLFVAGIFARSDSRLPVRHDEGKWHLIRLEWTGTPLVHLLVLYVLQ